MEGHSVGKWQVDALPVLGECEPAQPGNRPEGQKFWEYLSVGLMEAGAQLL
jgi:hypothetical protein